MKSLILASNQVRALSDTAARRSRRGKPRLDKVEELLARVDVELPVDMAGMGLGGAGRYVELVLDEREAAPLRQKLGNLGFAWGQPEVPRDAPPPPPR